MKKLYLISSMLVLSISTLSADNSTNVCRPIESNSLDFVYTVNKTSFMEFYRYNILITKGSEQEKVFPLFTWGEQGEVIWTKRFHDSIYSFMGGLLGLHNHFEKKFTCTSINEAVSAQGLGVNGNGSTFRQRDQINLFKLDLFLKADLKQTKHACFNVYGGALLGGFRAKSEVNFSSANLNFKSYINQRYTDYFMGPNVKIGVTAPFLNNRLILDLRAGLGYIMTFCSFNKIKYDGQASRTETDSFSNVFRTASEFDVLASVGFKYKNFLIAGGVNQFCFMQTVPRSALVFGGPFAKMAFDF